MRFLLTFNLCDDLLKDSYIDRLIGGLDFKNVNLWEWILLAIVVIRNGYIENDY